MNRAARALIVGIDDYPSSPLAGCINDAHAVAEVLERHDDGSPNFAVKRLTSDSADVSRDALLAEIEALLRDPADVAVLYFSGHGFLSEYGAHLVTPDATGRSLGVSAHELGTIIKGSKVSEIAVFLDCCDSGGFGAPADGEATYALLREGVSFLTASRQNQSALESGGAGVFTGGVVEALAGGAADVVGTVTTAGVYAYLDEALGPWDQRPMFKAHLSRLTQLRRCHPAVDASILRNITHWFPTPDHVLPLDPSYEPTTKPKNPDNERTFGQLQKCRAARIVEPVGHEHMYYAATESHGCRLTALGRRYWRLADEGRL